MVNVVVDGVSMQVEEGTSILGAALQAGVRIPTLCAQEGLNNIGACRVCVVEVEGRERLAAACNTEVWEGMVVEVDSPKALRARRTNVELILSQHKVECATCARGGNCSLQRVASDLGILSVPYEACYTEEPWSKDFPLIRDGSKCIRCMRCVQVCESIQGVGVWTVKNSASRTTIGVRDAVPIEQSKCAVCGQCITHCPVGALRERDDIDRVLEALADPGITTIVQVAPAVRAAWGEGLGISREQATEKMLVAALKAIGFDYVYDTNFAADMTIMEEGSELLERLSKGVSGPMFTSCCPGWVRFLKSHCPERAAQLSTAKSPQQMFGALAKSYMDREMGIDPERTFCVSVMPCTAKKYERAVESMNAAGDGPDVDAVLTTREIDRLLRGRSLSIENLEEVDFDSPLGMGTGAAAIFGATGGVMEAALRSAYYLAMGKNPDPDAFEEVRGGEGWREKTFELGDVKLRLAVASGLGNARDLLRALDAGEVDYDFVEIMACPGGCAGGGGQPIKDGFELAAERSEVLYELDRTNAIRFSHENPSVVACYEKFLGKPLSERAEHFLHTDQSKWEL